MADEGTMPPCPIRRPEIEGAVRDVRGRGCWACPACSKRSVHRYVGSYSAYLAAAYCVGTQVPICTAVAASPDPGHTAFLVKVQLPTP